MFEKRYSTGEYVDGKQKFDSPRNRYLKINGALLRSALDEAGQKYFDEPVRERGLFERFSANKAHDAELQMIAENLRLDENNQVSRIRYAVTGKYAIPYGIDSDVHTKILNQWVAATREKRLPENADFAVYRNMALDNYRKNYQEFMNEPKNLEVYSLEIMKDYFKRTRNYIGSERLNVSLLNEQSMLEGNFRVTNNGNDYEDDAPINTAEFASRRLAYKENMELAVSNAKKALIIMDDDDKKILEVNGGVFGGTLNGANAGSSPKITINNSNLNDDIRNSYSTNTPAPANGSTPTPANIQNNGTQINAVEGKPFAQYSAEELVEALEKHSNNPKVEVTRRYKDGVAGFFGASEEVRTKSMSDEYVKLSEFRRRLSEDEKKCIEVMMEAKTIGASSDVIDEINKKFNEARQADINADWDEARSDQELRDQQVRSRLNDFLSHR